jgi:hypothetical protein
MRLRYLGVIAFLLSASVALGDGCYIPERAVRKIPDIVAQHAVLSWKDGVETLVISSALDSEAQTLGWIIPVPAVPTTIEKATPGALKTLDFCIQPKITHDLSREVRATILVVFVGNLLWGTWLFKRKRFGDLLLLLFVLFILSGLLLSALGSAGAGAVTKASAVQVEKTATVGSYTISILRPSRPDGLDGWLAANGFASLPETAGQIIADYISQGWVFAAIKLTRGESGANAPHPIKLVFASKEAVYPMKLTAVAGGKPGFELFVIGDDRAACDTLEEEFCDRFSKRENKSRESDEMQWWLLSGQTTDCEVGHAAICSLMWDDCVLTKFVGSVDAASMTKDIHFTWKPFTSHQEHFFTQYGAGCVAVILFVFAVGGWNVLSIKDYARGLIQPKGFTPYFLRRLLPAIVCAAIVAGICFALLPKLGNSDVQIPWGWRHADYFLSNTFEERLKNQPEVLARTESEIADFLLRSLHETIKNETLIRNGIAGGELKVEDSPGNFTVEKQANQVIVRVYDRIGTALVKAFPIEATGNTDRPDTAPGVDRRSKH